MSNLVVCFKEEPVEQKHIDRIQAAWPDVNIINVGQNELPDALLEADFFCGHAKIPVDWKKMVKQGRLQWIQSSAAGMDWCLTPPVIKSNIVITTASGVLADQVAEHTLALILAWMRNLPLFLEEQHAPETPDFRKFIRRPTRDLTGATVGIVGFGGVGRRIAEILVPFQATVLATDLYPSERPSHVSELLPADQLDDMLYRCDVVILCLPLNNQTRGIFNAERLKHCRPGTLFVNMARGPLVVTDDLVEALRTQTIAGAIMDVTSPEPLPPNHPLWDFPNVIITPHVAGQSRRRFDDVVDIFTANIRRRDNDQPLINFLTPEGKKLGFPIRCPDYPLWIDLKSQYRENAVLQIRPTAPIDLNRIPPLETEQSTQYYEKTLTRTFHDSGASGCSDMLLGKYNALLERQHVHWDEDIHFKQLLGRGGQGVVFLSEQQGTDGFMLPVAIKIMSPERFPSDKVYEDEMCYMAKITGKVAEIQHDNLLTIYNWRSANRIRFLAMEWVDGFALSALLRQEMLNHLQKQVSHERWIHLNNVVVTNGLMHPRMMPGVAIPIIRDCLAALAALHREGIVHGDVKPSNIMLKRTGNAKLVDIGSAFLSDDRPPVRPFTLAYAAPEVLEGKEITPRSDIASLGYVLIEMLSGRRLFGANSEFKGLEGRLFLASQLNRILPQESSAMLKSFCRSLVAPDPNKRYENAEAADLVQNGAADFERELVKGNLACESAPEIRSWLDDLKNYGE